MSADHKGMIAFSKTLCKFYAQPVCFFRGNLTRAEGLAHMIGNHIICATHSSGSGNVLPLCQKELRIRSPAVTRIAGNEPAVICFLWVGHIVDDVTDRPTLCAAFADMKRHDSCSCHKKPSSQNIFSELFVPIVEINSPYGYNIKKLPLPQRRDFYDRTAHC